MKFLGIDVGSTFLKSSILDTENFKVMEAEGIPTPAFAAEDSEGAPLSPERREIPMDALAKEVRTLIDAAAQKYEIAGVVFSVQMHGFMLFSADGKPLTNYISWQDTRGVLPGENGISVLEELRGDAYKSFFEENGVLLRPNHSVVPLTHFMRECRAAAKEKVLAPGTRFAMIGDALTYFLTGTRAFIHPTNAASSGLYSLQKGEWNRELLAALGLENLDMPPVEDTCRAAGIYKTANGAEIPLYAALGDQQATVLGIGTGIGDVFINIGTGGQIGYVADAPVPGPYETRPFFEGNFIRTVTQLPSGRTINVLMQFLKSIGTSVFAEDLKQEGTKERTAEEEKELERKIWSYIDTIDFENITAPPLKMSFSYFDSQGGSIENITDTTFTIDNLFRSAYAEIAGQYAEKAKQLGIKDEEEGGIVCTGGVIRKNRPLFQCIAGAFSRPCRIAECTDDSMEGLLKFAARCARQQ